MKQEDGSVSFKLAYDDGDKEEGALPINVRRFGTVTSEPNEGCTFGVGNRVEARKGKGVYSPPPLGVLRAIAADNPQFAYQKMMQQDMMVSLGDSLLLHT